MRQKTPLAAYISNYTNNPGCGRDLRPAFQQLSRRFQIQRALYPGSWLDVTPSLFFPEVCYVDSLSGILDSFADPDLRRHLNDNKHYPDAPTIHCYQHDYRTFNAEPEASFDLLISLNAGFISQACKRFLSPEGLLLVNDEHYDARRAFVDPDYILISAFTGENLRMETSQAELTSFFHTTKETPLTLEMVEADSPRSPSRARFKPAKTAPVYLFRKQ